jgi:formamidopyrimidine-DNA glycosylase
MRLSGGLAMDFIDQRTFGHLSVHPLIPTPDAGPGGFGSDLALLPAPVLGIARDLLDPGIDVGHIAARIHRKHTDIKRALLDQGVVSGIGNIYADEALWAAEVHFARQTDRMRPRDIRAVLNAAADVMRAALRQGGTSFDAMYVDVNGNSGYFERALAAYGREGEPCPRCGTPIRRDPFMNRSSFTCPRCQRQPRA